MLEIDLPKDVAAAFDGYDVAIRGRLHELRALIFSVAERTPDVGPLQETLKWGEPAYLTAQTGAGSTIRISRIKSRRDSYGLFVNCRTNLIEQFRQLYHEDLEFSGNRAIVFDANKALPREQTAHCIALALTYHLRKSK